MPLHPLGPAELRERFDFLEPVGEGGMGVVWKVRDRKLDRLQALKLCLDPGNEEIRERFVREAEGLARVRHPNLVEIYDYGELSDGPYLVMELLEGTSLVQPLRGADPLEVMLAVADALEALHGEGIVHRDVKPANILMSRRGPVLLDLGLLKGTHTVDLTRTGQVVGTLGFMAPELWAGGEATRSSDWFSWGATLYAVAERKKPFTVDQLMGWSHGAEPVAPDFPISGEDSALARVALACLMREPGDRPTSRPELEGLAAVEGPAKASEERTLRVPAMPETDARPAPERLRGSWMGPALALAIPLAIYAGYRLGTPAPDPRAEIEAPTPTGTALPAPLSEELVDQLNLRFQQLQAEGELDSDPVVWPELRSRLGGLGRFHAWLSTGADPFSLPEDFRERLRRLDRAFSGENLPRPFHPFLYARATPEVEPLGRVLDILRLHNPDGIDVEEVTGWLGTAVRASRRSRALYEARQDRLSDTDRLLERTREMFASASHRRWYCGELREASELAHRAVYACMRAAREHPEEADLAALVMGVLVERNGAVWLSGQGLLGVEEILGTTPRTPAEHLMAAALVARRFQALKQFALDPSVVVPELRSHLIAATRPGVRTHHSELRVSSAWSSLVFAAGFYEFPRRHFAEDLRSARKEWGRIRDPHRLRILYAAFFRMVNRESKYGLLAPEVEAMGAELEVLLERFPEDPVTPRARKSLRQWRRIDASRPRSGRTGG